jgi:ABC-type uncharacterized transport system permease subunit
VNAFSSLIGVATALLVAAIGFFHGVAVLTLLVRVVVTGVGVAFLVRVFGFVLLRVLTARFVAAPTPPPERDGGPGHG